MKIIRTPPCFSIGMDDWLTDIEYEQDDQEPETPHIAAHLAVPEETPLDRQVSSSDDIDDDILACCDVEDSMFGPLIVPSQDRHWQP